MMILSVSKNSGSGSYYNNVGFAGSFISGCLDNQFQMKAALCRGHISVSYALVYLNTIEIPRAFAILRRRILHVNYKGFVERCAKFAQASIGFFFRPLAENARVCVFCQLGSIDVIAATACEKAAR